MASIFAGFSDTDANAVLNWWFQGGLLPVLYIGLLTALPTDSVGDGLAEPWLPSPYGLFATSVNYGGYIAPGRRYYEVTEVNASGETTASAELSYLVPSGTSTNTVTLSWTGSGTPGNTFNVYEAGSSGAEGLVAWDISTTYFQDMGITPVFLGSPTASSFYPPYPMQPPAKLPPGVGLQGIQLIPAAMPGPASPGAPPPTVNTTGWGYARVPVAANSTSFPAASGRSISNGSTVTFPTVTGTWDTVNGWSVFDGPQANAEMRVASSLLDPVTAVIGSNPVFGPDTLVASVAGALAYQIL